MPYRQDDMFCSRLSDNYTTDPKPTTETPRVQFYTLGHVLAFTSDSEDTESRSDEFQVSVAWDATGENETLPE